MNFKAGDAVVHPARGAGVVDCIEERQRRGNSETYYRIQLLHPPGSKLLVPTSAAKELGLRRAISQTKLKRVWCVLRADPGALPEDYKKRYQLLRDKLKTGDAFQVAEVVRDMAWRQRRKGRLNTIGKQLYEKGMSFLTGEIAAVQDVDLAEAEVRVRARLTESLATTTVT
ncbi:MAG: hypothetical protein IMY86_08635 [Chloroflexi bacterium]|jgi:CarD family transcriptional regulator|nr:hypothetical protein [Chloroflexota bacterium]